MADLKLKARIASAEAEEKVYAEFEEKLILDETVAYPIQEPKQERKTTTQPPVDLPPSSRPPDQSSSSTTEDNSLYIKEMIQLTQHHQRSMVEMMQLPKAELMTFNGDPLKFWEFWRAFQVNVDDTSVSTREFPIVRERRHVTPCLSSAPSSTYRLIVNNNNNDTGYCERLWTYHALHVQCNTYGTCATTVHNMACSLTCFFQNIDLEIHFPVIFRIF